MTIEKWANNANAQYEQKRIAKEKEKSERSYTQYYFIKLIEWGCVAFTMLFICGKLFEWIDTTTAFESIDKLFISLFQKRSNYYGTSQKTIYEFREKHFL